MEQNIISFRVSGEPVEGMEPAVLKVEEKTGCDSCKVSVSFFHISNDRQIC